MNQVKWQFQWHTEAETKSILVCHLGRLIGTCNSDYTWSISKVLRYSMHCQGISQFYLHTLHFICKWNELYLPFPSQPQLVLIYRPGRNGRLCCEVTPAKIRTCNLPITSPVLNHTATATTLCLKIRVRTIPRSIPNTIGLQWYQYPIPILSMTSSDQHISVTNLFPPANVTASHYRRRSDWWTVCAMRRAIGDERGGGSIHERS